MATCYSKMMAICYPNSKLWCYIDSNLSLSKAENWAAVGLNAFFLIWFVPARSWAATFSSNDPVMSWWLTDKSTPHLYSLKHLSWSWRDQVICICVLYLNIHPIHTQFLNLCTNSYLPLYHHHYLCINMVVLLVTHKTTRSQGIEISTYLAITSSPWQCSMGPLLLMVEATHQFHLHFVCIDVTVDPPQPGVPEDNEILLAGPVSPL